MTITAIIMGISLISACAYSWIYLPRHMGMTWTGKPR